MSLADLIAEQSRESDLMSRAFANLKKKGQPTKGGIESRLAGLEAKWAGIVDRHKVILSLKKEGDERLNYFKANFYEDAEETFMEERAQFIDAAAALKSAASPPLSTSTHQSHTEGVVAHLRRKLPPIDLPKFLGKYSEWTSYKDLFQALVDTHPDLSNVEQLHYLKASLIGDAEKTIKNLAVTAENYQRAWEQLSSYYDNIRSLVNSSLTALFQIRCLSSESAIGLKQLRDATLESIKTLEAMHRPVDQWSDILVFLTAQRLDSQTRRDWETTLGNTKIPFSRLVYVPWSWLSSQKGQLHFFSTLT